MPTFPERQVLLTANKIEVIVYKLAEQISSDVGQQSAEDYLLLICVLESARRFAQELQVALYDHGVSTKLDYISASSYGKGTVSSGKPTYELSTTLAAEANEKAVLIVDDMIDTGITLALLVELIRTFKPLLIAVAVLIIKDKEFCNILADKLYKGESTPDLWVDGHGIDSGGKNRELDDVWAVLQDEHDLQKLLSYRVHHETLNSDASTLQN